jgi:hypothetical protein
MSESIIKIHLEEGGVTLKKYFTLLLLLAVIPCFSHAADTTDNNFNTGIDLRLRYEIWDNVFDLNDHGSKPIDDFFRMKASLWGKWDPVKELSLYYKVTGEPWYYVGYHKGDRFVKDEVVLDNLYLDIKKPFDLPLNFRVGRQDFLFAYGEGFLIMDGTPGDGSRTFYFNAVKSSWQIADNNTLDLVYINDPKYDFIPDLHDQHIALNSSDEQGVVLYSKNKINDDFTFEPYYIWKQESAIDSTGSTLDLHTLGAHAVYNIDQWKLHGEFAHQFGQYNNGIDREANGGYMFVDYTFKDVTWEPVATFGAVYLSGDNRNTKKIEEWDPLFSRWPWLSELYLLTWVSEKKAPGYWTNLQWYRSAVKLNFTKKTSLDIRYNYLRANELTNISGSIFSNDGYERGHLPQVQLNHKFTNNLYGYILLEYFIPGDFYVAGSDNALFFRTELVMKF